MPVLKMNCLMCQKEYIGGIFNCRTTKFCSRDCRNRSYIIKRSKKTCLTCGSEFLKLESKKTAKFCSVKCIRYQGDKDKLKTVRSKGFWQNATEEQKFNRLKDKYEELVVKNDGCWSWKRKLMKNGYASLNQGRTKVILAHRLSWMIHNGPIINNSFVLHKCDNPPCSNPEHLFLGTPKDNSDDMISKNRKKVSSGIKHYNVKLTVDKVIEIKTLIKEGFSQGFLGRKFNVSPSTIQNISDGKTWKNIKEIL